MQTANTSQEQELKGRRGENIERKKITTFIKHGCEEQGRCLQGKRLLVNNMPDLDKSFMLPSSVIKKCDYYYKTKKEKNIEVLKTVKICLEKIRKHMKKIL